MYTVSIDTGRAWLSDPTNPDAALVVGTVDGGTDLEMDGDIRVYAGNIVEGVARQQDTLTKTLTLKHLSPTQRAQVIAWRGQPVLLRTADGDRIFGFYLGISQTRVLRTTPDDGTTDTVTYDLGITFNRVSFDETQLP